jgi:NAD-dependent DNA ligase
MENGTREEMEELAEEFGAIVQKSINGKTTILVVGSKPGSSKLNKAKELDVKIITEVEFNNIVE